MQYVVHTVADGELPEGLTHVIVNRPSGPPLLILAGAVARCWWFMRGWEATQEPDVMPTITIPSQSRGGRELLRAV